MPEVSQSNQYDNRESFHQVDTRKLIEEISSLEGSAIIELFELDTAKYGGQIYRFHAGKVVQGDIIYGTGTDTWDRLAKGTAAQVLKMNTAANAPEWGNLSSDWVLLNSSVTSSSVSSVSIDGHFTSDYDLYKLFIYRLKHQIGCGVD